MQLALLQHSWAWPTIGNEQYVGPLQGFHYLNHHGSTSRKEDVSKETVEAFHQGGCMKSTETGLPFGDNSSLNIAEVAFERSCFGELYKDKTGRIDHARLMRPPGTEKAIGLRPFKGMMCPLCGPTLGKHPESKDLLAHPFSHILALPILAPSGVGMNLECRERTGKFASEKKTEPALTLETQPRKQTAKVNANAKSEAAFWDSSSVPCQQKYVGPLKNAAKTWEQIQCAVRAFNNRGDHELRPIVTEYWFTHLGFVSQTFLIQAASKWRLSQLKEDQKKMKKKKEIAKDYQIAQTPVPDVYSPPWHE
ncbi:hypothetical protein Q9966_002974 [Columba livia]|nr:hypothetical protein Q9966_002974 [Columba livia]